MVKYSKNFKKLLEEEKKSPGRPRKAADEKVVKLSSFTLPHEQYTYIIRMSKYKRIKPVEALRLVVGQHIEDHPDEELIAHRREMVQFWNDDLDNIEKIYLEDKARRVMLARSMIWAFIENNIGHTLKENNITFHLANVKKMTGLDPLTIEELFETVANEFKNQASTESNKKLIVEK